jgi:hypothetical protein
MLQDFTDSSGHSGFLHHQNGKNLDKLGSSEGGFRSRNERKQAEKYVKYK